MPTYRSVKALPQLKDFTYNEFKKIADKSPFTQAEWAAFTLRYVGIGSSTLLIEVLSLGAIFFSFFFMLLTFVIQIYDTCRLMANFFESFFTNSFTAQLQ